MRSAATVDVPGEAPGAIDTHTNRGSRMPPYTFQGIESAVNTVCIGSGTTHQTQFRTQ